MRSIVLIGSLLLVIVALALGIILGVTLGAGSVAAAVIWSIVLVIVFELTATWIIAKVARVTGIDRTL